MIYEKANKSEIVQNFIDKDLKDGLDKLEKLKAQFGKNEFFVGDAVSFCVTNTFCACNYLFI